LPGWIFLPHREFNFRVDYHISRAYRNCFAVSG